MAGIPSCWNSATDTVKWDNLHVRTGNPNTLIYLAGWTLVFLFAGGLNGREESVTMQPVPANQYFPAIDKHGRGESIIEIKNPVLQISDRCVSCHRFDAISDLPDPRVDSTWVARPQNSADDLQWLALGRHPGGWLNWHSPAEFGCTVCHGGNGQALDYEAAGHLGSHNSSAGMQMYDWTAMQARCGSCHPGDYVPGAEDVWRGRILIRELNCAACHTVGPNLNGTHRGPSLSRVGEKLTRSQIASWPNHSDDWLQGSRMPQFRTIESLTWLVACYLAPNPDGSVVSVDGNTAIEGSDPDNGLELIRLGRCANCHILPRPAQLDKDDPLWSIPHGRIGPDLTHIADRVSVDWLKDYIADPAAWYPETRMPDYSFDGSDVADIVSWLYKTSLQQNREKVLTSHRHTEPEDLAEAANLGKVQAGAELFVSLGCSGCHDSGDDQVVTRSIAPDLRNIGELNMEFLPGQAQSLPGPADYFQLKLDKPDFADPAAAMPRFDISATERRQIAIALLAERRPPSITYVKQLDLLYPENALTDVMNVQSFWPRMIQAQGSGPDYLTRFERDLSPESCAVCHREQYQQWQESRHARAMEPGVTGQLIDWITDRPADYNSCMRCHARLARQNHIRPMMDPDSGRQMRNSDGSRLWEQNPHFQPDMYKSAHGCANCHVRVHRRFSTDTPNTQYFWNSDELSAHQLSRAELLRKSEFCKDCHQFDTDSLVPSGSPPRENTFAEWREWFATAQEPKSCQQCHMDQGDHRFLGIHDKEYVMENTDATGSVGLNNNVVTAQIDVTNTGAGHMFPTYITPKVFTRGFFRDSEGNVIWDSHRREIIGRGAEPVRQDNGKTLWIDQFDTRIAPGNTFTFRYSNEVPTGAESFSLVVFVAPDDFYHRAYGRWLDSGGRSEQGMKELSQAFDRTRPERTGYYLLKQTYLLSDLSDATKEIFSNSGT